MSRKSAFDNQTQSRKKLRFDIDLAILTPEGGKAT
jgi:hypothetical protein